MMTRMIPSTIHPDVKSGGERRIFELFKSAPGTDGWVCLHSLGIAEHAYKRRAEIDFLLLTSKGVFVLEVKSGRVARRAGEWIFTDRYGTQHTARESPFDQASSAMFALERRIRKRFNDNERMGQLLFGYGVMFPDVEFDATGCEAEGSLIFDARDRSRPFSAFVDRLTQFTYSVQTGRRLAPDNDDISRLVDFLRGDFDVVPSLSLRAEDARHQQLQLTREQYVVLDGLDEWPRCVIQGSAGTGKTVLALEAARRELRRGRSVLLLCFNRLLAGHMAQSLSKGPDGKLFIGTVYQLLEKIIQASSFSREFQDRRNAAAQSEVYAKLYPEYGSLAALENPTEFSCLIVDEAQDMMTNPILDALENVLQGGLRGGRWRFLLDANNQAAVYGSFDSAAFQRLLDCGCRSVLTSNCRNTRQVNIETELLARPRFKSVSRFEGSPVRYGWYSDKESQAFRLKKVVEQLIDEGVPLGSISVLSPRSAAKCCAMEVQFDRQIRIEALTVDNVQAVMSGRGPCLTYCSISAFKGLENDFIVLTDIEKLESEWWQSVIYVGMSRACAGLVVLLRDSLQRTYESMQKHWLQSNLLPACDAAMEGGDR